MNSELDVLVVEESVGASAIAGALRPLSVGVASSAKEALAEITMSTPRAVVVAQEFRSRIALRLHPRQITLTKPQVQTRRRRGTLAKPFSQSELAHSLAVEFSEPVSLQSLGTGQASIVIRGVKFPLGTRSLAIAQVHRAWNWSDPQTIAFRHFLAGLDHVAIGERIGKTRTAVKSILRRASEAASLALGEHFSAVELRSWLLGRCMDPG